MQHLAGSISAPRHNRRSVPCGTSAGRRVGALVCPIPAPTQATSATMGPVSAGKRAGSRRGARPTRKFNRSALVLGAAITLLVVAWGYLVYAAIDFGTAARGGSSPAWTFMGLACAGAIACLFVGLLLVARLMRVLGLGDVADQPDRTPRTPRTPGGKRAAR